MLPQAIDTPSYWMYYEEYDAQFAESVWQMLLPRSVVGVSHQPGRVHR